VARLLVVEADAVAAVADLVQSTVDPDPVQRRRAPRLGSLSWHVGWRQPVAGQRMLDIGEDQLLVLLLVMAAELDRRQSCVAGVAGQ
jgi:hypothetical protein